MKPNATQKEFLYIILYMIGFIFTVLVTAYLAIPFLWDEFGELKGVVAGIGAGAVYNLIFIYLYLGNKK